LSSIDDRHWTSVVLNIHLTYTAVGLLPDYWCRCFCCRL